MTAGAVAARGRSRGRWTAWLPLVSLAGALACTGATARPSAPPDPDREPPRRPAVAFGTCFSRCQVAVEPSPLVQYYSAISGCYERAPATIAGRLVVSLRAGRAFVSHHAQSLGLARCVDRALARVSVDTGDRAMICSLARARRADAPLVSEPRIDVTPTGIAVQGDRAVTADELAGEDGYEVARREIDRVLSRVVDDTALGAYDEDGDGDSEDGEDAESEDDDREDSGGQARFWVAVRGDPRVPAASVLAALAALPSEDYAVRLARAIGTSDAWVAIHPRGLGAWPGCPAVEHAVTVRVDAAAIEIRGPAAARTGHAIAYTDALDTGGVAALREQLAAAHRAQPHRTDLAVIAAPGVLFRPVAQVVEIADRAGFWDIELIAP